MDARLVCLLLLALPRLQSAHRLFHRRRRLSSFLPVVHPHRVARADPKRDRRTREERWEQLDEDLEYDERQLDRQVQTPDQIRTVIQTYRDRLPTEIFPGRREVPKTLVFAKDDNHAEEIVRIVREEFGRGDAFCCKITYKVTGRKPEDLINDFRNSYNPRIAVTVDMIATGTDVRPLEVLLLCGTCARPTFSGRCGVAARGWSARPNCRA